MVDANRRSDLQSRDMSVVSVNRDVNENITSVVTREFSENPTHHWLSVGFLPVILKRRWELLVIVKYLYRLAWSWLIPISASASRAFRMAVNVRRDLRR